jgi:hypothetical protein
MEPPLDIYTEPDFDVDTRAHLGPLGPLAGSFVGERGLDVHPAAGGDERDEYRERIELVPIDAQTNGPQLLYGLRYHQRVVRLGEVSTFHDQTGYWLWEPATSTVTLTLSIPRAQVALAVGTCASDATTFTVRARRGSSTNAIGSGAFLDEHFTTVAFEMTVSLVDENSWRYEQLTEMRVRGREGPVLHRDTSTLVRVGPARANPTLEAR